MEKNKNIIALAIGFFLILIIAAITFYKPGQTRDLPLTDISQLSDSTTLEKKSFELTSSELIAKLKTSPAPIIVDTRDSASFLSEHILDAKNIPHSKIISELPGLERNSTYVIVDDGDGSGLALASEIFPQNNLKDVFYLIGGFKNWKDQGEPTISSGDPNSFTDQAKVSYLRSDGLRKVIETEDNFEIIDLRSQENYQTGHIPGAINIFIGDLESHRQKIPIGKKIILYDKDGLWAFQGAVRLFDMGIFNTFCLADGLDGWKSKGYPLSK